LPVHQAGGDTDQLKAAAAGVCDHAVRKQTPNYCWALRSSSKAEDRAVMINSHRFGPTTKTKSDRGAHVNVRVSAITASSKNKENAAAT